MTTAATTAERRQFQVLRCLGRGGFGEVYHAHMLGSGGVRSEVALKVLHANMDPDSQALQRLNDEGRLLGYLKHPAILRVTDLVLLDGRVALVTEYVEGSDLEDCFKGDEPIPTKPLVEVIGRVADALHAAYDTLAPDGSGPLHLVHRDVKPANIRVGRHGDVKLLDFGIARASNVEREAKTQTNAVVGSTLYMAPERLDERAELAPPGDVFALGLTLYEGLVHRRFFGTDITLMEQYRFALNPAAYLEYRQNRLAQLPDLPDELRALLIAMLDPEPADRPSFMVVAARCESLVEQMSGATLRQWCREREWPEKPIRQGELDGQVITETPFSGSVVGAITRFAPSGPETTGSGSAVTPGVSTVVPDAGPTEILEGDQTRLQRRVAVGAAGAAAGGLSLFAIGGAAVILVLVVIAVMASNRPPPEMPTATAPVLLSPTPVISVTAPEKPPEVVASPVEPVASGTVKKPVSTAPPEVAPKPVEAVVATTPEPAVVAGPPPSSVKATGKAGFELRGAGGTVGFGGAGESHELPAGRYEVWADFGEGIGKRLEIDVAEGSSVGVKCTVMSQTCAVSP